MFGLGTMKIIIILVLVLIVLLLPFKCLNLTMCRKIDRVCHNGVFGFLINPVSQTWPSTVFIDQGLDATFIHRVLVAIEGVS